MIKLLIVDDGHGIDTAGKRTPVLPDGTVMHEQEFNDAVSRIVTRKCLMHDDLIVVRTTQCDIDVPLNDRSDYANKVYKFYANKFGKENVQALFISIHANALTGVFGSHGGIETFYYQKGKYYSKMGKAYASIAHQYVLDGTKFKDRGVKGANFHVLRETIMPAILFELGFMDNLHEANLLLSKHYREECGDEIYRFVKFAFMLDDIEESDMKFKKAVDKISEIIEELR